MGYVMTLGYIFIIAGIAGSVEPLKLTYIKASCLYMK